MERLLQLYGPNALSPPMTLPVVLKFAKHLVGGFSLLLLAASALSFVAYGVQYVDDSPEDIVDNVRRYPMLVPAFLTFHFIMGRRRYYVLWRRYYVYGEGVMFYGEGIMFRRRYYV